MTDFLTFVFCIVVFVIAGYAAQQFYTAVRKQRQTIQDDDNLPDDTWTPASSEEIEEFWETFNPFTDGDHADPFDETVPEPVAAPRTRAVKKTTTKKAPSKKASSKKTTKPRAKKEQ